MNFEPHTQLAPVTVLPPLLVVEHFGSDAEREWNRLYLGELPEPSPHQLPCQNIRTTSSLSAT